MKICPEGVKLFDADIQTDMTKLTVPFHSCVNLPTEVISVTLPAYSVYWPRQYICSYYLSCGSQVTTHLQNLNIFTLYSLQP